jgi:hypothetical protein
MIKLITPLSQVDTAKAFTLGTQTMDKSGNIYIYMQGVASTIVGSWVTYDEEYATTLLVANASGPVAVSMGINVASTYGWYQIFGKALACVITACADNAPVGFETTAGYVGDGRAAGDMIYGAISRASSGAGTGIYTVQIWYPFVTDGATV